MKKTKFGYYGGATCIKPYDGSKEVVDYCINDINTVDHLNKKYGRSNNGRDEPHLDGGPGRH